MADEEKREGWWCVGDACQAYVGDGIGDWDGWAEVRIDLAAEFEGKSEESR